MPFLQRVLPIEGRPRRSRNAGSGEAQIRPYPALHRTSVSLRRRFFMGYFSKAHREASLVGPDFPSTYPENKDEPQLIAYAWTELPFYWPIVGRHLPASPCQESLRSEEASLITDQIISARPIATYRTAFNRFFQMASVAAILGIPLVLGAIPVPAAPGKRPGLRQNRNGAAHRPEFAGRLGNRRATRWGFIVLTPSADSRDFYSRDGKTLRPPVTVPPRPDCRREPPGSPTGLVANPASEFEISKNGKSAPALYLFSTLDGLICGWNPSVDPDDAVIIIDDSTLTPFPASYDDDHDQQIRPDGHLRHRFRHQCHAIQRRCRDL